ncbi:MAG: CobW family GTP-binding protein [Eubacteriales bacterium]
MTKIDVFSGFLGAGKTTLIKKLIKEAYTGEKIVLIENEFGEIGIDGGFLQDAGIAITEMNSGCICCTLVGDFAKALRQVLAQYAPDRVIIEPSGVGKLSDVVQAVEKAVSGDACLNSLSTVVDAKKCHLYMKNFGEFFGNQITHAKTVLLSRTAELSEEKLSRALELIVSLNPNATVVTTDWSRLDGVQLRQAIEHTDTLAHELEALQQQAHRHSHDDHHDHDCDCGHDHHDHDCDCDCGHDHHDHDHDHDHDCDCGHDHHDHDHHDHNCDCGHEHHDHDHDCDCGHDHHDHDHNAEQVFTSWGIETPRKFSREELEAAMSVFDEDSDTYGAVLRAKGMVAGSDGQWLYFDYVPGEHDIRTGAPAPTGRLCVIGSALDRAAVERLFFVQKG